MLLTCWLTRAYNRCIEHDMCNAMVILSTMSAIQLLYWARFLFNKIVVFSASRAQYNNCMMHRYTTLCYGIVIFVLFGLFSVFLFPVWWFCYFIIKNKWDNKNCSNFFPMFWGFVQPTNLFVPDFARTCDDVVSSVSTMGV